MSSSPHLKPARPLLPHMSTTPDLVGGRYDPGIPNSTPEDAKSRLSSSHNLEIGPDALLAEFQNRSNEEYRDVVFPPQVPHGKFQLRISFDTIDIRYHEGEEEAFLDSLEDDSLASRMRRMSDEHEYNGRGRRRESDLKVPSARSPVRSPSASPTRMMSPHRNMASLLKPFLEYPTTPIITHRGTALTRVHQNYEDLYQGNLGHMGLQPVLPRRVIMVYISGRKHTWVGLDWILRNFIEHGDTVVIFSAINHKLAPPANGHTSFPPPGKYNPKTPKVRLRQRSRPEFIKHIALSVMNYALSVINKNIIAKVTVEIIDSNTKDALKDMYKLYEPNLVCVGSKANTKNSAPLKSWHSSRLSDRLVKNFPIPVIVVPAVNMGPFEKKLLAQMEAEASGKHSPIYSEISNAPEESAEPSEDGDVENDEGVDSGDLDSLESSDDESVASSDSYSSFKEITDIYKEKRLDLIDQLDTLMHRTVDENYFTGFAKAISDNSLELCNELRKIDPDFKGKGAKLASAITGSTSFGKVPYKTRSMLTPEPNDDKKSQSSGKSYNELKKQLTRNAQNNEAAKNGRVDSGSASPTQQVQFDKNQNLPSIKVDRFNSKSPSPFSQAPKASALKFSELETPNRYKERNSHGHGLKKFFSNDERSSYNSLIKPTKSNPETRSNDSDDKKRKKKKKFWIF